MEGKYLPDAVFFECLLNRNLVGDVAGLDGIAFHDDFAVTQEVVIDHVGSDHGDDDLVVANDAATGGFGEGELMGDGP